MTKKTNAGKEEAETATKTSRTVITRYNPGEIHFDIVGETPYVQLRFSQKAEKQIMAKQRAGSTARKGAKREARDYDKDYVESMYATADGRRGIPARAFRNAMVAACKLVGFHMTKAKPTIFVQANDVDVYDGTGLVYIEGKPEKHIMHVRNATGVADLRVRAMWRTWRCKLIVRYDADLFTQDDIVNLVERAGRQIGVGEGRNDSKSSCGMGWGSFTVVQAQA